MEEFITYLLRFGSLNEQEIDLIARKGKAAVYKRDDYFVEAGKILKQVGFLVEGVFRICYYNKEGDEITRYFIDEDHLLFNPHGNEPFTEYIQAATDCKMIIFSNKDWKEIAEEIAGWEKLLQKAIHHALVEKLERRSPLVAEDATTRYLGFLEKFPSIANRVPLGYIASYLGVTQQSLSRIRKNIR